MGSFEKYKMWGWGSPQILGNLELIFKFWTRISQPPRGLGKKFWYHRMQNSQENWTYKADGGGSLPEFLAIFLWFFFGLKNFIGAILKIVNIFFAEIFYADSTAIVLSCELEHIWGSSRLLAPFGPPKWPTILANYEINSIINSGRDL